MIGSAPSISKPAAALTVVGIVAMPLQWIPLAPFGPGKELEIPNAVALGFALVLPFAIFLSRRMWRIHLLFGLLVLWSLVYWSSMVLHDTPDGMGILGQQFMQAIYGWTLALCIAHSDIKISHVAVFGLFCVAVLLHISAATAGINLLDAFLEYIKSGDRIKFIYFGLSPSFNAFVSNSDVDYAASMLNTIANCMSAFIIISFIKEKDQKYKPIIKIKNIISLSFVPFLFLMFSMSANIVIFSLIIIILYKVITNSSTFVRIALPFALLAVFTFAYGPLSEITEANLEEDTASRGARLEQYATASEMISNNVLSGVGFFRIGKHPVHNWPLFSWATSGYILFIITILFYIIIFISGKSFMRHSRGQEIAIIPLWVLIFIRTSVGGAGSIPFGSAIIAISVLLGLLERYHREARVLRREMAENALEFSPTPPPPRLRRA